MMEDVKKILIAGAGTGAWWNAGDEAICKTMIADLRAQIPNAHIFLVSANPAGFLTQEGLTEIPFDDITLLSDAIQQSDLVILGGGGIFYDHWHFATGELLTSTHSGLGLYFDIALLATLHNKPLMLYAVGVGPLQSDRGKENWLVEYGHKIWLNEVDGGIISHYCILDGNPGRQRPMTARFGSHQRQFGRPPEQADDGCGLYSAHNEEEAKHLGIERVILHKPGCCSVEWKQHKQQD